MRFILSIAIVISVFATAVTANNTYAQSQQHMDNSILILAQKKKLSPSAAAKQAERRYGGKVVKRPVCRDTDSGTVCSVVIDVKGRIKTVTIRG